MSRHSEHVPYGLPKAAHSDKAPSGMTVSKVMEYLSAGFIFENLPECVQQYCYTPTNSSRVATPSATVTPTTCSAAPTDSTSPPWLMDCIRDMHNPPKDLWPVGDQGFCNPQMWLLGLANVIDRSFGSLKSNSRRGVGHVVVCNAKLQDN